MVTATISSVLLYCRLCWKGTFYCCFFIFHQQSIKRGYTTCGPQPGLRPSSCHLREKKLAGREEALVVDASADCAKLLVSWAGSFCPRLRMACLPSSHQALCRCTRLGDFVPRTIRFALSPLKIWLERCPSFSTATVQRNQICVKLHWENKLYTRDEREWPSTFPSIQFPFPPIPIPNFLTYSHSHRIPVRAIPIPSHSHSVTAKVVYN